MLLKRRKTITIAIAIWVIATLLSVVSGVGFPALLNYVHEIEYGCSEPIIVNGIWIRPCVNSSSRSFTAPLIYSYHSTGPPFSIGLTVLDYANENDVVCQQVVVSELSVTIGGVRTSLLNDHERIIAPFEEYLQGTTSTKADAYVELDDRLSADDYATIHLDATLLIHTDKGVIRESVSCSFDRGGWSGIWLIWEALSPHA